MTISNLPRLRNSDSTTPSSGIEVFNVDLPIEISDGLKKLARDLSVPVKNILLAAHLRVMSLLTNQADTTTGLIFNGRLEEEDADRVLGLFLNTLPMRMDLSGGTWKSLIEKVFEKEREMFQHRRFPLAEIQRICSDGQPLFETSFNFMHYHVYEQIAEPEDVQVLGYNGYEETNFTLTANFSLDIVTNRVRLGLNYHQAELTKEQIETFADYYKKTLKQIAVNADSRFEEFSPLSDSERKRIIEDNNDTAVEYEPFGSIVGAFSRQALACSRGSCRFLRRSIFDLPPTR